MVRFFHVVHASVWVVANMRNLFLGSLSEFFLSSNEIIIVEFHLLIFVKDIIVNIIISHLMLSVLLSDLKNHSCLFFLIVVVWIDEHELIVMTYVIVLVDGFLSFDSGVNLNAFFLDQELRILMDQKWSKVLVFPLLLCHVGSLVKFNAHLFQFFVFWGITFAGWHW